MVKKALPKFVTSVYRKPTFTGQYIRGIFLALKNRKLTYAAFTLSGFGDEERNLMFVKTAFQVLKLEFLACNMK